MVPFSTPPHDVLQGFKALLLASRSDQIPSRTAVITTSPELWTEFDDYVLIVDISGLVGDAGLTSIGSESGAVKKALIRAGWPASSLIEEYRPDLKNPGLFDIAVMIDDQPLLAVEIKRRLIEPGRRLRDFRMRANGAAKFLCISDGGTYTWVSAEHGPSRTANVPPTPADLGIQIQPGPTDPPDSRISQLQDWQAIQEYIAHFGPENIIVDFTIPNNLSVSEPTTQIEELRRFTQDIIPPHTRDLSVLLLTWLIRSQRPQRLAALVPSTVVSLQSSRPFREFATERLPLLAAVDLPPGILRPVQHANYTAVFFGEKREGTYFDLVGSPGDLSNLNEKPWFASLLAWFSNQPTSTGFIQRASVDSWSPAAYHPEIANIRERLGRFGELKDLGEVCEVRRGPMLRGDADGSNDGEILIQGRSLRNGVIDLEDARRTTEENIPEWAYAQPGDILIPEILGTNSAAVIYGEGVRAVISHSVLVLRVIDERVSPEQIAEYLNSPAARRLVGAFASRLHNVERIIPSELRKLPVPIIDASTFRNISQVRVVEELLKSQVERLASLRLSLFDSKDRATFFESIDQLKNRSDVLGRSITDIDRPQFRISNFYPFPIAYGYRLLDGILPSSDLYREQLRVAENLLAFVASICLSLIQKADRQSTGIDLKTYWQGGISPGHWKDIIARCSKVLSSYKDHPLATSIARLNVGSESRGIGKDVQSVIRAKNDFKHDRGPTTETDMAAATKEMAVILERIMMSLGFLTEYPIRQVVDMNSSRHGAAITLRCLVFTGDHPGLRHEEVKYSKALTKGDLYLDLRNGLWLPLFPFITALHCPRCKVRETYFIDRWPGSAASATVKSFERGHTEEINEISEELTHWVS